MRLSLGEIAAQIGARCVGDASIVITGLSEPATATANDLALATSPKYAESLPQGAAIAALLWDAADFEALGLKGAILPTRPRFAFSGLTRIADPGQGFPNGLHPGAIVYPGARIGKNVTIGAFTVIAAGAVIGDNCTIGPHCSVGVEAQIGPDSLLRDHVSIGARVRIGARFVAQPGARVGSDGFSFVTEEKSLAETARESLGEAMEAEAQPWHRIHSLGAVVIGDDVELGGNTCIDSGTIRPTQIGDGTKMDNLVHIGHNVVIGRNCLICGQVGISGSSRIGDHVVLGGQVGVSDNISVGDRVIAGGASKIFTNVPAGRAVLGHPATKMDSQIETYKAQRRLPRLARDIAALKKAVFKDGVSD